MSKKRNKIILLLLLIVLLLAVNLRLGFLDADPFPFTVFGTTWVDEGVLSQNSRHNALFGDWKLEGNLWNPLYISPTHTILQFLFFEVFGVSTLSARLAPALLGIASVLLAGLLLMFRKFEEGAIFMILLLINPMLIAYSRIAMLEPILLSIIILTLGLLVNDRKLSWFLVGVLMPILFFSKITSAFFIASIPLTLLTLGFLYKSKEDVKKFWIFLLGAIVSLIAWLFWLIPNFSDWKYMNFEIFSNRFAFGIKEAGVALVRISEFFLLNPLISIGALLAVLFTLNKIRKKEKSEFLDLFLVIVLVMFLLQVIATDFPLRRFVLLVPILALASTRLILSLKDGKFTLNENSIKLTKSTIAILFILLYITISLAQLLPLYANMAKDLDGAFTIKRNSQEIAEYIPAHSKVYGNQASSLSLENRIAPYHGNYNDRIHNPEKSILPLLQEGKINYALMKENIFDEADLKEYKRDFSKSPVYTYLRDNFEIIKEIEGKHSRTNEPDTKYIYRRINLLF